VVKAPRDYRGLGFGTTGGFKRIRRPTRVRGFSRHQPCPHFVRVLEANKPQELPAMAALGAYFCWDLAVDSGTSRGQFSNGIQEDITRVHSPPFFGIRIRRTIYGQIVKKFGT
jgi:hypothetical protein